jgi:nitroreductase
VFQLTAGWSPAGSPIRELAAIPADHRALDGRVRTREQRRAGGAASPRASQDRRVKGRAPAGPHAVVDAAITSRQSIRAFRPDPVSRAVIEQLLNVASRAPSGTNIQPWKVYVLTGEALSRLSSAILAAFQDPGQASEHTPEYAYYPVRWSEPYLTRRRKLGWDLYGLLGIGRDDRQRMRDQHGRNFAFFDAPVGLIFTIDRALERGSWLDYGMFLQNLMVAARARGLDTCPQAAFTNFHRVITAELDLPDSEMIVCGMALGVADMDRIENTLVSERASLDQFVVFRDS